MRGFFASLLALDSLDTLTRPVELFPQFTPTLGAAMKQETLLVLDDLVFARDGDYRHLFDQQETFVNAELAALYGVPAPAGAGVRARDPARELGPRGPARAGGRARGARSQRRHLADQARALRAHAPALPGPAAHAAGQPADPAAADGPLTARQRLEQHAKNAVCAACHQQTDPVGLSLEHFDAMGVYRETDHGLAIDDTGEIGGHDIPGRAGLGAMLRDHPALGPCLIQSLYGVGVGHLATEFDRDTFASHGQGVRRERRAHPLAADRHHRERRLPLPARADGELKDRTMKKLVLSRRRLLRGAAYGVGAAVGLPVLDAMLNGNGNALAARRAAAQALRRLLLGQRRGREPLVPDAGRRRLAAQPAAHAASRR